ncbi:hypothetical protein FIBSPDRAFT_925923 [Athelia psychrophila]|uniref:M protein, serotype 2.1 n=1 Tax=Athelia psychrophila TaxID=1759441 RepID=A0A166U1M7_9AGAM|nr:hypothetical protein FIBSPDRAFT_925923 [Fibularhizoctonia sp. CBS 109695]
MATTTSPRTGRATPPSSRRTPVSPANSPPNSITKGATARSAVTSPRVSSSLNGAPGRRASLKGPIRQTPTPPPLATSGDVNELLSTSLKEETERKEQLLVQLQDKDQTIASLMAENTNYQSAMGTAEIRLNEFFADQARNEEEMNARIEVAERLRTQLREIEKEKRDIQRRYNEQTSSFDSERQAAYDNEQHLKSRIQSLTQARRQPERPTAVADVESEAETDTEDAPNERPMHAGPASQDLQDPDQEPAEMTSLKLELSTLSTSYSSLQNTLLLLQTQLVDLKRVNNELQEENESYMILLRERTLNGQFDVMKQVGTADSDEEDDFDDEDLDFDAGADVMSTSSAARSMLDPVEEEMSFEHELERSLEPRDSETLSQSSRKARSAAKHSRKRGSSDSQSPGAAPRGESLAGLPLTGPGLDLAAELGRAENKDILDGEPVEDHDRSVLNTKGKRGKKGSMDTRKASDNFELGGVSSDGDALRAEVKSLKDANKALSLYASKIIDRIISQEGFEHVLAVDFDSPTDTKSPASGSNASPKSKLRPIFTGGKPSTGPVSPKAERLTTFASVANSPNPDTVAAAANRKNNRRSLSFDWKSFSMFGGTEKKPENSNLRSLTLKPGATTLVTAAPSARKLDTEEDDEDRRERERLQATMKLMGIEPPTPTTAHPNPLAPSPLLQRSNSVSSASQAGRSRWSFFGGAAAPEDPETAAVHSTPSLPGSPRPSIGEDRPPGLTHEALAQVEAQNSLAALDAREQTLSAEMARGSGGGFTEIARRGSDSGRRSRKSKLSAAGSGSASGSTVWSAGVDESEE